MPEQENITIKKSLGQIGCEAYYRTMCKTLRDSREDSLPWDSFVSDISKQCWESAASAIKKELESN